MQALKVGDICVGTVFQVATYGLWVEVDGIPGLLRIPELSWERIQHPGDVAQVGDQVRFVILGLNDPLLKPHEQFCGSMRLLVPKPES